MMNFEEENTEPDDVSPSEPLRVSVLTRRNILDALILLEENQRKFIHGRLDLVDFLKRIWPLEKMPSTDPRFKTAAGDIGQHMINNYDWNYNQLFDECLNLLHGPDIVFLKFVEEATHPLVRVPEDQDLFVSTINEHISKDGFKLHPLEQISGYPVYRAIRTGARVKQRVKNLIFAADGYKPEIVFDDSISNDIRIVKYAEYCLIYDHAIPQTGLRWTDLVAWWANQIGHDSPNIDSERDLYKRLYTSLQSPPEKIFFRTYFKLRDKLSDKLPALIPQVYLHYDPYTHRQLQGEQRIPRQRMDFLLLFSNHERVVIEIDGVQHYSQNDKPSPQKYGEMVAEDRKLRLQGYEVYRFGGYEISDKHGEKVVEDFISLLMQKYGLMN